MKIRFSIRDILWEPMILKTLTTVLLFLAIQSVQGEEPKGQLFWLFTASGRTQGQEVMLVDGQILAFRAFGAGDDPEVKPYAWNARFFELQNTEKGQLIVLRPKKDGLPAAADILEYEGKFVTADYSSTPPSLKLTKEAEKYSYWKVPKEAEGPIVNVSDFKKPAYLSVDSKPLKYKNGEGNDTGYLEYFRVTLSLDSTNLFKVTRRPIAEKKP
jgi:hypothetical protein